ncbi:zinc finger SWIM domain-containing protein 7 isoform 8-T8 [Leptosomus discolor]
MPSLGLIAGLRQTAQVNYPGYSICGDLNVFPLSPVLFCLASSHEANANEMNTILPAVAEELLKEIKKAFQETSHVPDDLLLGLKFIFGPSAVPALDLVDQRSVTRVTSPSGRTAYQRSVPSAMGRGRIRWTHAQGSLSLISREVSSAVCTQVRVR